jgi:hypothetical protein
MKSFHVRIFCFQISTEIASKLPRISTDSRHSDLVSCHAMTSNTIIQQNVILVLSVSDTEYTFDQKYQCYKRLDILFFFSKQ